MKLPVLVGVLAATASTVAAVLPAAADIAPANPFVTTTAHQVSLPRRRPRCGLGSPST